MVARVGRVAYPAEMGRTFGVLVGLGCAWMGGCGEDAAEAVEYGELCGVEGAVRVLELAPDQRGWSASFGERLYHSLARVLPDDPPAWVDRELWSTGPCGESPVRVATEVWGPFVLERWPEQLFGCHEDLGLVSLDPAGAVAPRPVFATRECYPTWTEHGALVREEHADDDKVTAVVLYPYPGDPRSDAPAAAVELFDGCHSWRVSVGADQVHCATPEGDLMRISLADRSVTLVQSGVGDYQFSADRRYLAWEAIGEGDQVLTLRDDSTGVSVGLGAASGFGFIAEPESLLLVSSSVERIYFLPGLDFIDLPRGVQLMKVMADGRWLLQAQGREPWLSVFDPGDRSTTPLFSRAAWLVGIEAEAALVLEISPFYTLETLYDQGRLWSVPLDGSKARVVAERATRFVRRIGETWMMDMLDIDEEGFGALVLLDTADRSERVVEPRVYGWSFEEEGQVVGYGLDEGERSGLWRARLR